MLGLPQHPLRDIHAVCLPSCLPACMSVCLPDCYSRNKCYNSNLYVPATKASLDLPLLFSSPCCSLGDAPTFDECNGETLCQPTPAETTNLVLPSLYLSLSLSRCVTPLARCHCTRHAPPADETYKCTKGVGESWTRDVVIGMGERGGESMSHRREVEERAAITPGAPSVESSC